MRSALVWLIVLAAVGAAVWSCSSAWVRPTATERTPLAGSRPGPPRRCSPRRPRPRTCRSLDAVGNTAGAQHRDGAPAGRRQDRQGRLQGRPGRHKRLRARRDRSAHLSGAVRSGGSQEGAGRGDARQRAIDLERYSGSPRRTPARSSRPTRRRRWSRNSKRRFRAIRRRSTSAQAMLELHQDHRADRRPHRHPPGRCRQLVQANDTNGLVVITQIQPISVCSRCRSSSSAR